MWIMFNLIATADFYWVCCECVHIQMCVCVCVCVNNHGFAVNKRYKNQGHVS